MPAPQHQATIRLRGDVTSADKNLARAQKRMDQLERKTAAQNRQLQRLKKNSTGAFGGMASRAHGAALAVVGGAYALDRMADRAVEVSNVTKGLKFSMDAAAAAVGNQTTKLELARHANKLATAGIVNTEQQYGKLAGTVAALADAQGEDLDKMLKKVTRALATGSDGAFRQLGIYVDLGAESRRLGHSLSLAEKQQILLNATMSQGADVALASGVAVDEWGQKWAAAKNRLIDTLDSVIMLDRNIAELSGEVEDFAVGGLMDLGVAADDAVLHVERLGDASRLTFEVLTFQWPAAAESVDDLASSFTALGQSARIANDAVARVQAEVREEQRAAAAARVENMKVASEFKEQTDALVRRFNKDMKGMAKKGGSGGGDAARRAAEAQLDRELAAAERELEMMELMGASERDVLAQRWEAISNFHLQKAELARTEAERREVEEEFRQAEHEAEVARIEERRTRWAEEQRIREEQTQASIEAAKLRADEEQRLREAEAQRRSQLRARDLAEAEAAEARKQKIIEGTMNMVSRSVGVFAQAAAARARDEKKKEAILRTAGAIEMAIVAAMETAKAVAAFAGFNYVEGALHVAAAALATATAVGIATGSMGTPSATTSVGGGGSAPTPTAPQPPDRSGAGQTRIDFTVAGSRPGGSGADTPPSQTTSGPTTNQTNNFTVIGSIDEDAAEVILRGLRDRERARPD